MKHLLFGFLLLSFLSLKAQQHFDAANYKPPYKLVEPKEWGIERFSIPIDFAPQIPYKGVEDIRFAPGWGDSTKDDYWSYCFLWYLDGKVKLTTEKGQQHLKDYYSGLVGRNIVSRKIPTEKLVPVIVTLVTAQSAKGDDATYTGTVSMLDYMQQQPIVLNCIVHIKSCPDPTKTFVFFELSPKAYSEKIWTDMNSIWENFVCGSN